MLADTNPFVWLAQALAWTLVHLWQLTLHISGNVAHLGVWWVLAYWMAVTGSWAIGQWGSAKIRRARVGNDFFEFAPGRANWVGKVAVLFELQVKADASLGYAVLGYAVAVLLLAVGALGLWTLALVGMWVAFKGAEAQRARRRRLTR